MTELKTKIKSQDHVYTATWPTLKSYIGPSLQANDFHPHAVSWSSIRTIILLFSRW
uniref:Uncharacterized protein n=1 Tax=Arundo donax TaxID=35708 RepID=A0A0A9B481_ARUDO